MYLFVNYLLSAVATVPCLVIAAFTAKQFLLPSQPVLGVGHQLLQLLLLRRARFGSLPYQANPVWGCCWQARQGSYLVAGRA